jgi:anaerobic selenocysteine-containing dehydrogenase
MVIANTRRIAKSVCNLCSNHCGINVHVENGKIVKVDGMQEHPFHNLCVRAYALPEVVHSSERLTTPLKKVGGDFKEVSWDEAFTFIVDRLLTIRQKYGAKAVVPWLGVATVVSPMIKAITRRFADFFGTPNYASGTSYCFLARVVGSVLTCGTYPNPDLVSGETKCIVVWGKNPPSTFASERDGISTMLGRGAKLLVIDPRRTPLAKKADIYAQIRPGTDCALALGLLNVIIAENLYDKGFVARWTVGFDKLASYVKEFSPERVEPITSISADVVRDIARTYASTKPACMDLGISLEHSSNGIQSIRALQVLTAITGNLDIAGGNLILPGVRYQNLRLPQKTEDNRDFGSDAHPLFAQVAHEPSSSSLTEAIMSDKPYPIKALLVSGANPLVQWPNSSKVKEAFEKLDLLVVMDTFMTDTGKMADVVLPAGTFLETDELRDIYWNHEGTPLLVKSNKAIEPIGNAWEDWKIWAELGRRMGYADYFPWKGSSELIAELLKPANITLEQLEQNPGGIYYAEREFQKYLRTGFRTPSGKVEIYSEAMAQHGYDPIPTFHEPVESPVSRPDLAEKYPLILMVGPRVLNYTHSQHRNIPCLRKLYPEPLVEMNYKTALSLGIADGETVKVENLRGSVIAKAQLTEDIHPKVVSICEGWSNEVGANGNCLTDNKAVDPVSGFPEFRSTLCQVTKE